MAIYLSEPAAEQIRVLRSRVSRHSPSYSIKLVQRIMSKIKLLKRFPLLGSEVPEYQDQAIRELYEEPYRILYRLVADEVRIISIIRDVQPLPRTPAD